MKKLELSEDLTIAPLQRYLRKKINQYKLKIGETEKGRNNEMKKYEQPDFSIHNTLYLFFMLLLCIVSIFYPSSFNLLGFIVPEKSVTKNFNVENWREKKNEKIKG